MRLAVLSDIHGNLHALEAAWADLQTQAPDDVICLGDLVGYGAFPNEVIDFVRGHDVPVIMGNYDEGVGYERGCVYKGPGRRRPRPPVAAVDARARHPRTQGILARLAA